MKQFERHETVIVGGGQAGLSVGYHLQKQGRPFVILDASERVGDSWRMRWDSLRLYSPASHDGLPGMSMKYIVQSSPFGMMEVSDFRPPLAPAGSALIAWTCALAPGVAPTGGPARHGHRGRIQSEGAYTFAREYVRVPEYPGPFGQPGHRFAQGRRLQRSGQERHLSGEIAGAGGGLGGSHHATTSSSARPRAVS